MTDDSQPPGTTAADFPDAGRIVDAFGGVRPMAARLGIAATTIQGWKSRGNIPEPRRQEVRDAAQAAGIDFTEIATPDATDAAGPGDDGIAPVNAAPSGKHPGRSVAWLALAVAIAAGAAVVTQPLWSPRQAADISSGPAIERLVARIAALESAPKPNFSPLTARIDALEAALKSLREAAMERPSTSPDLAPRLDSVLERLETLSAAMRTADTAESAARESGLDTMRAELSALRTRLDKTAGGNAPVNASAASLILAVSALENAVMLGTPFEAPLSVVEQFAKNDPALAGFASALARLAAGGVPTQAQLTRDFLAIAAQLGAPLWTETGVPWIDGMLQKIDSLITIRRLEDAEGAALPAVQVERALADNDLPRAIAALDDASGPGAAWAARAKSRVAADRAVAGLRLLAIEALGAGGPAERAR